MLPDFKFSFSWKRMLVLSGWASFNKAISGGGYGPIMTTGQMTVGRNARESVAVTDLSEAFLSGYGFLLYIIFQSFLSVSNFIYTIGLSATMILSGLPATPLGALFTKRVAKKKVKKIIGTFAVLIGVFTVVRFRFAI